MKRSLFLAGGSARIGWASGVAPGAGASGAPVRA